MTWKALFTLLLILGGPAAAQDGSAPPVPSEAPVQPGAPSTDPTQGLPALPGDAAALAPGAGTTEAPAAGTATPPAQPDAAAPAAPATAPSATGPVEAPPAVTPVIPDAPAPEGVPLSSLPAQTDLYHIVLEAHWVVQAVMAGLVIAAFATLVIFIHKTAEFAIAFAKLTRTARRLAQSADLDAAAAAVADQKGPAAEMIRAAQEELVLSVAEPALRAGVRDRTEGALARIEAGASQRLRGGTGILASIGSLSPFVGLFGTVFGIMNSFLAIAETKTTNLAVVAPGIAEALLATAIGLAAAIPAVLIYNICARRLAKYRHRLADVAAAAQRLQSRALDRLAFAGS